MLRTLVSFVVILSAFVTLSCVQVSPAEPQDTEPPVIQSAPTSQPTLVSTQTLTPTATTVSQPQTIPSGPTAPTPIPLPTNQPIQTLGMGSTPAPQPRSAPREQQAPPPTPTPQSTQELPPPPAPAPAPPTTHIPEPINISGSGTAVASISLLTEGLWVANISVSANEDCSYGECTEDNFIVQIQSVDGSAVELPVNEIAKDWNGAVTVSVGGLFGLAAGNQIVTIDAAGDWNISFDYALPLKAPDDPNAPVTISGSGTRVESISLLSEGVWIVDINVSGNEACFYGQCTGDNFIVTIEPIDASSFEMPVNEIASEYSGQATVTIGGLFGLTSGTQLVSVDASGDWTITFTKA